MELNLKWNWWMMSNASAVADADKPGPPDAEDTHDPAPETTSEQVGEPEPDGLPGILDRLVEKSNGDTATVGSLVKAFGTRSFGPMLLIPAIIAVAPTGAIPGMSIVTGSIILVISLQMLVGRDHIWLPDRALSFEVPRDKLKSAVEVAKPWAHRVNALVKERLSVLSSWPFDLAVPIVCAGLALSMFPLALVPFAVAIPGTAVAVLAIGLTFRDGVFLAIGYALALATGYAVYAWA